MTVSSEDGPWIVDPGGHRDAALTVALLRRRGFTGATRLDSLARPGAAAGGGLAIVLGNALGNAAAAGDSSTATDAVTWCRQSVTRQSGTRECMARRVLIEPPLDAAPLIDAPPRLRVGQRPLSPARVPAGIDSLDDEYLGELIEAGWDGFEVRRAHGRSLPPTWIEYLWILSGMLADRSAGADRDRVLARVTPFARSGSHQPDARQRYLMTRLEGGSCGALAAPAGTPELELIHHAHLVAADNSESSWRFLLDHLDLRRGQFRRSLAAPPAQLQLHPVLLCAVARRIGRFRPRCIAAVTYPAPGPAGPGPTEDGSWLDSPEPGVFRLRGTLLTDAARRFDPPDLTYPYRFDEWSDITAMEDDLFARLAPALAGYPRSAVWPDGHPYCVCVRHDVDRALTTEDMERHLDLEESLGLKSTWFFKKETFDARKAEVIRRRDGEIGYHAEAVSTGDDGFVELLTGWLGGPPGVAYHFGFGSEAWRGRRSLQQAMDLGLRYAEMPIGSQARPAYFCSGDRLLPVTPLAVKFDEFPDRYRSHAAALVAASGLLIVENHPDLYSDEYAGFLAELASGRPLSLTVADALDTALPASRSIV